MLLLWLMLLPLLKPELMRELLPSNELPRFTPT